MSGPVVDARVVEKAAALPRSPGVYLFRDAAGRVLYAGKASDLRSRVRQYLSGGDGRASVPAFMPRARDLDFVVTRTAGEALLLENTLIKRHRPPWNVRLRDDKAYPCLRLDLSHEFPRFTVVRRFRRDGALYFGPFADAGALRRTMRALRTVYPLRSCSDAVLENRTRPCVYFEIGRCNAPCVGLVAKDAYAALVQEVVSLLRGDAGALLKDLAQRMGDAAGALRYEEAAILRDRMRAIERTVDRQVVAGADGTDRDAVAFRRQGDGWHAGILFLRHGAVAAFRMHRLATDGDAGEGAALASFLVQFYERGKEIPAEVLVPFLPEEREDVEAFLSDRRGAAAVVRVPERGFRREIMDMAERNLVESLRVRDPMSEALRAGEALRARLGLDAIPRLIECMDVSNLGDRAKVASRVAMEDGVLRKDLVRTLRIRTVEGQDDFAAMREAVRRRFSDAETFGPPPDLLLVDGGRGQLGAALEGAVAAGVRDARIAGLAKARPDRPGDGSRERVFLEPHGPPVVFRPGAPETLLLERVRDEAHRVAIGYHRLLRGKAGLASVLDSVPGIGPKRRTALLRAFGSSRGIAAASTDAVAEVLGSKALAERVLEAVRAEPGERGAGGPDGVKRSASTSPTPPPTHEETP